MEQISPQSSNKYRQLGVVLFVLICCTIAVTGIVLLLQVKSSSNNTQQGNNQNKGNEVETLSKVSYKKFANDDEFKQYITQNNTSYGYGFGAAGSRDLVQREAPAVTNQGEFGVSNPQSDPATPTRTSETNVQVLGIDEPDIVKNNKDTIFLSRTGFGIYPLEDRRVSLVPPERNFESQTDIINAFPPEDLKKLSSLKQSGDLLLHNNTVIVLGSNIIQAYDISNRSNPTEKWKMDLQNNNYVNQARLYDNKIYLVLGTYVNPGNPCPLQPITIQGQALRIACTDVYYPSQPTQSEVTFTALSINPDTGSVNNKLSFVGSANNSTVYMSKNSLYVAYAHQPDYVTFFDTFISEKAQDLFPESVRERVKKLKTYDLSYNTKLVELTNILQTYQYTKNSDDRLKAETELQNRMSEYTKEHRRELDKSGIVKINLNNFSIGNTAVLPGHLLNQFSMDEHNDHLRVATTIAAGGIFGGTVENVNDLYVLDKEMRSTGKILDMGKDERIYSARFVGDKGYLVTFKQIDPFYVLDLSNPQNPAIKGELKIPGFSSYLHPLADNRILGIGRENSQLKISLFDVSNPTTPTEVDKYILEDYSSDILSTHHAFLHDAKHSVFFVPGTQGGYVFSYNGDNIELKKAVADVQPQRAIYIDDYMYIIGNDKIVVLNENDWKQVKTLSLP